MVVRKGKGLNAGKVDLVRRKRVQHLGTDTREGKIFAHLTRIVPIAVRDRFLTMSFLMKLPHCPNSIRRMHRNALRIFSKAHGRSVLSFPDLAGNFSILRPDAVLDELGNGAAAAFARNDLIFAVLTRGGDDEVLDEAVTGSDAGGQRVDPGLDLAHVDRGRNKEVCRDILDHVVHSIGSWFAAAAANPRSRGAAGVWGATRICEEWCGRSARSVSEPRSC